VIVHILENRLLKGLKMDYFGCGRKALFYKGLSHPLFHSRLPICHSRGNGNLSLFFSLPIIGKSVNYFSLLNTKY